MSEKILDGLTYTPTWISHMGCPSGCTRYLDIPDNLTPDPSPTLDHKPLQR